jgi:alkylated DNA repair dioxygenase AlkB
MTSTLPLFPEAAAPAGFRYEPALVGPAEEAALIRRFENLPFAPFDFRGFKGNRQTVAYGSRYDFTRSQVKDADPIPDWLRPLKAQAAVFACVDDDALVQALVTEYQPGAGIGWHRDRPEYGKVIGVSFNSACVLRLRRRARAHWLRERILLEPRSAYLLDGEVRDAWQHSIAPGDHLRYSVTFRTLR